MIRVLLLACGVVVAASALATDSPTTDGSFPVTYLLAVDLADATLSFDDYALNLARAIRQPEALPERYRQAMAAAVRPERSATHQLLTVYQGWDDLSPATQTEFLRLMARPSRQETYVSPYGFFRLHYDTFGGNAVPLDDLNSNSVPDYIEACAAYLDTSRVKHIELGFRLPPSDGTDGGDSLFDVYFEQMGFYGYAVPEDPGPNGWNDVTSYLAMHRNFIGFPPNADPEGNQAGAAKATAAHEFHHCVQFAYDPGEPIWYMELDATWMEDIVFDIVDDNYNYLPSFMNDPEKSLMATDIHMYASFIFNTYLSERFDTALIAQAWEGARFSASVWTSLADSLQSYHGFSLDSAMAEFAAWNYATGSRWDADFYEEGAAYQPIDITREHATYPVGPMSANPAGYAASYIRFFPGALTGDFQITFDGADGTDWQPVVVLSTTPTDHSILWMNVDPFSKVDTIVIPDFDTYYAATLVGVNATEFGGASSFSYTASREVSGILNGTVSADTGVYSGSSRNVPAIVYNEAEASDIVRVSWADSLGWVVLDSVDRFIAPGDSTVVNIPVAIPVLTPLGTASRLFVSYQSQNEPSVSGTTSRLVSSTLYRGDTDWSGEISLPDLSWLINYLFLSGLQPLPEELAGDVTCDGSVGLPDISALVDYLFITFTPPPCNPY